MKRKSGEERREVARKLRECRGGWSSGECYYTIIRAIGLPDTSREDGGHALYSAIADLIEPEPERACHAIYEGDDAGHEFPGKSWRCSSCGHKMDEYEAKCGCYCIKCGARLVDYAD